MASLLNTDPWYASSVSGLLVLAALFLNMEPWYASSASRLLLLVASLLNMDPWYASSASFRWTASCQIVNAIATLSGERNSTGAEGQCSNYERSKFRKCSHPYLFHQREHMPPLLPVVAEEIRSCAIAYLQLRTRNKEGCGLLMLWKNFSDPGRIRPAGAVVSEILILLGKDHHLS